jgi:hypothetical protein
MFFASTLLVAAVVIGIKVSNLPLYTNEFGASLTTSYDSVEGIKKSADVIAEVEIKDLEYFEYSNIPFTLSNAVVTNVHKGDIKQMETIHVLETGGVIDNVEYAFEGEKVLKKDEKAIVFLNVYEGPIKPDVKKYVVAGVYQGKFRIDPKKPDVVKASALLEGELAKVETKKDILGN